VTNGPIILEPNEDGVYSAEAQEVADETPAPAKQIFKSIGRFIISACILAGLFLIAMMFVKGGVWVSREIYPALSSVAKVLLYLTIFILTPLTAFKRTRAVGGFGLFAASYVFGLTLWVWSLILTYKFWGIFAVILGLFFAGVGIVPIGVLATLFKGEWSILMQLILLMAFVPASRSLGIYMITRATRERRRA